MLLRTRAMKILLVGGGGREHALAWRLVRDGHHVIAAPGNPGIAAVAECVPIATGELERLTALAAERGVDLAVIGPEAPLVAGLADRLRAVGVTTFGPGAAGAALEGSKIFAKRFFARHGVRSAAFRECGDGAAVERALAELGGRVVVKADGLAAGKGVVVCDDADQARAAAAAMMAGRFGDAGRTVIVEHRLVGRELSVMALTDGQHLAILPTVEDHKTLLDGDRGPNTGGMGTVSPCPWATADLLARIEREILQPTLAGLAAERIEFRGVLYAGVLVDEHGVPWILEYNVRFGDPETQPVALRLAGDLGALLHAAARGQLSAGPLATTAEAAVCVVVCAAGYPEAPRLGDPIAGLAAAEAIDGVRVFHAGTARADDRVVTDGGRVVGVTASGPSIEAARALAYRGVGAIEFEGAHHRRDIGRRGAAPENEGTR